MTPHRHRYGPKCWVAPNPWGRAVYRNTGPSSRRLLRPANPKRSSPPLGTCGARSGGAVIEHAVTASRDRQEGSTATRRGPRVANGLRTVRHPRTPRPTRGEPTRRCRASNGTRPLRGHARCTLGASLTARAALGDGETATERGRLRLRKPRLPHDKRIVYRASAKRIGFCAHHAAADPPKGHAPCPTTRL